MDVAVSDHGSVVRGELLMTDYKVERKTCCHRLSRTRGRLEVPPLSYDIANLCSSSRIVGSEDADFTDLSL
jgi:hypothetical protein